MTVLGGVICRTPVSSPWRFWPAWTGIKAETSAVAAILGSPFLLTGRRTWQHGQREKKVRDATCVFVIALCVSHEKVSQNPFPPANLMLHTR